MCVSSCRWYEANQCAEFETDIVVCEEFRTGLLYRTEPEQKPARLECPVCEDEEGSIVWYKVCLDGCLLHLTAYLQCVSHKKGERR